MKLRLEQIKTANTFVSPKNGRIYFISSQTGIVQQIWVVPLNSSNFVFNDSPFWVLNYEWFPPFCSPKNQVIHPKSSHPPPPPPHRAIIINNDWSLTMNNEPSRAIFFLAVHPIFLFCFFCFYHLWNFSLFQEKKFSAKMDIKLLFIIRI